MPTPEQQKVIDHMHGPALVPSVAGSGKTYSVILRAKRLIERGVRPWDILITTFSKRGASDMERRGRKLDVPAGVSYRTLHSLCFEILRKELARPNRKIEVPKNWQVTRTVRDCLRSIAAQRNADMSTLPKLAHVMREISLAKSALVWPDIPGLAGAWKAADGTQFPGYFEWATSRERDPAEPEDARVYERCYCAMEQMCRHPGDYGFEDAADKRLVTFDDMVALTARAILCHDEWVRAWRGRFPFVIVDEVQDNSVGQWVLVEYLARNNCILAVGDDQQSIYEFRGSQPKLMRQFLDRHPQAVVLPLSFNFRCGQKILDAANKVLANAKDRVFEGMLQRGRGEDAVGDVSARGFADSEEEAAGIAESIAAELQGGTDPNECAVLYRINAQAGPVEIELIKRSIPYRVAGSSFFNRGEIKSTIGYIRVALDNADEVGWKACCNVPTRRLGNAFLEVAPSLTAAFAAIKAGKLKPYQAQHVRDIADIIEKLTSLLAVSIGEALYYILEDVGVRKHFRDESADEEIETEVDEACEALVACASTLSDPQKLVGYANDMVRIAREDHDGDSNREPRVTLSTVHKAKGLEWGTVWVAGMTVGLFPFKTAPMDEERRLGYVALTRAKDRLYVSWSDEKGPSSLVKEAGLIPDDVDETLATQSVAAPRQEDPVTAHALTQMEQQFVQDAKTPPKRSRKPKT